MRLNKYFYLFIICILCVFSQGYKYEYVIDPLDAARNAANRNNTAIMYMEMGHYQAAETEFKIAISLLPNSPNSAAYYNNLGLLYLKINNFIGAKDCFQKAIDINPVFLEYYKNLVATYAKEKSLDEFLELNLEKISQNSSNSEGYLYAGLIYAEQKNYTLGIQYLSEYIKLEKNRILSRGIKQLIYELQTLSD